MLFFGFSMFPLAVIAAVIAIAANRKKSEDKLNDAAPVQTITVRIAAKRSTFPQSGSPLKYFMTFEAPDGTTLELNVDDRTYNAFRVGEIGDLVYQRMRFLGFNPQVLPYDAQYGQEYGTQQMPGYPPQDDYHNQTPLY